MLTTRGSIRATIIWSFLALGLATQYNACSQQVIFSQSLSSLKNELLSASLITINQNAQFTNDRQVDVELQNDVADEVYVTNDPTCNSGGAWEPMQASRAWTLSDVNKEVFVYARYRNKAEGVTTGCVSDSIIHDGEPPSILLNEPNMITNVNTPIFNFLAWDSISGVKETTCKWPGQKEVVCNFASSNGNVAEGVYNVAVGAKDNAGNVADPTYQVLTVDRTPPRVILNSAPAAITSNGNAAYVFTGQDNLSGVKGYECAKETAAAFASCTSPVAFVAAEGPHKFFIRAIDNAGNVSPVLEHDFTIDMTAPTVRILSGPGAYSNSPSAVYTFDGMDNGAPITVFECRVDAGSFARCTSPKSYSGLTEGDHTFYVRGQDSAGLYSAPVSQTWNIDTAGPVVAFTQTPASVTNSTSAAFRYTITDAGSGVASAECSLDAAAFAVCDVASFNSTGLVGGSHTLKVRGKDRAGNVGLAAAYTWTIDLTAPTLVLNSGPAPYSNSSTANFAYTATDAQSGIARVDCRLDAAAYAPCNSLTSHSVSGLVEGGRKMSIRAVDQAGNYSNEVVVDWIVDLSAPVISYYQQPASVIATNSVQTLGFTVVDSSSGVQSTTCTLNGVNSACASGVTLTWNNQATGSYTFVITARDNAGNTSTSTRTWDVRGPNMQTQLVNVNVKNKVDVVVIIDNSGSMTTEMASMKQYFSKFLQQLNGLDWQISIITTDPRNSVTDRVAVDAPKMDGRMVELSGMPGQFILKSSMDFNLASTTFGNTIQMPTDGSGNERGILTAKRAIQRAFDGMPINANSNALAFRDDAALAFVIVSDAYDDVSQPADLINEVKAHWNGQKVFAFHSIVVPENSFTNPTATAVDPNDPCKDFRESVHYDGRIYYRLSELTGGVKATECSNDYGSQLSAMGKATIDLVSAATLNCPPVDVTGDGKVDASDVQVTASDGTNVTAFTVNGNKLNFAAGLPPGTNTVKYYCF